MRSPPAGGPGKRSWRRRLAALALLLFAAGSIALAVPAIHTPVLTSVGGQLVFQDSLVAADALVIAPDAGHAGVLEAADLMRAGTAPRVIVLGEPATAVAREFARRGVAYEDAGAEMMELLRRLGVQRVDVVRLPVGGTEDAGRMIPILCERETIRAIVVVTGADHSRRFRRVLGRTMRGSAAKVIVRPSRYSEFTAERWWHEKGSRRRGIVELQKLVLDILRHPLS